MDWFQFETRSSSPYTFGDRMLTVHSQVLQILTPFGGLIWNFPIAVTLRSAADETGSEERFPIIDVTRLAQIGLFGLALVSLILFWRKRS